MKTLILNGSPRKTGDTKSLINEFLKHLAGEYRIVDAYYSDIKPCLDCRWCWKNNGCSQKDGMQEVYQYIQECDNIVIASPIYFGELTGELLSVASRLQTYFCAQYFRKEKPIEKCKKGAVILAGGGGGSLDKVYDTACILLHEMNSKDIHPLVYSFDTNTIPAVNDPEAIRGVKEIAQFFNT